MGVTLIEIKQDVPGFNEFFGSWLCEGELNVVIDAGPANSAERLVQSLASMGLDRLDYILLTHIHIDHAGGVARLLDAYPEARVICHEKAVNFLVDPSRLWAGSLKVLGKVAEAYGEPEPVPLQKLIPHPDAEVKGLHIVETPGHAAHHLSYCFGGRLFAGEAAGNYLKLPQGEYIRPATPPRFFMDVCLKSVDRLMSLGDQPICYAHFGQAESSHRCLEIFRDQLLRWEGIIREEVRKGGGALVERCMDALLRKDPCLQVFHKMGSEVQEREKIFMSNSIRGYLGFLREAGEPIPEEDLAVGAGTS